MQCFFFIYLSWKWFVTFFLSESNKDKLLVWMLLDSVFFTKISGSSFADKNIVIKREETHNMTLLDHDKCLLNRYSVVMSKLHDS